MCVCVCQLQSYYCLFIVLWCLPIGQVAEAHDGKMAPAPKSSRPKSTMQQPVGGQGRGVQDDSEMMVISRIYAAVATQKAEE